MPRTRDDIDQAQREEQADHERALNERKRPRTSKKPGKSTVIHLRRKTTIQATKEKEFSLPAFRPLGSDR